MGEGMGVRPGPAFSCCFREESCCPIHAVSGPGRQEASFPFSGKETFLVVFITCGQKLS